MESQTQTIRFNKNFKLPHINLTKTKKCLSQEILVNDNFKELNSIPLYKLYYNKNHKNKFNSLNKKSLSIGFNVLKMSYYDFDSIFNTKKNKNISYGKKIYKKENKNDNNSLQGNIGILLKKFYQIDKKYKLQNEVAQKTIDIGDKNMKLTNDFLKESSKYSYCSSKHDYKKQYSQLFRRIKNIHENNQIF